MEVPCNGSGSTLEPLIEATSSACPVCGIYFESEAGVQMHIMHKHPEINAQAKLSFRKDVHALFGLPFCRFCQGGFMIGARLSDTLPLDPASG